MGIFTILFSSLPRCLSDSEDQWISLTLTLLPTDQITELPQHSTHPRISGAMSPLISVAPHSKPEQFLHFGRRLAITMLEHG
ncbi:hypothetical protein B0T21DRAFT_129560 [Apiosordaria backusii]|uniref:Uncharacterized protein n=1 Tax=Apiosordaria backusii TaxID=314023 RepID=A0AA40EN51_9PEZI|nr:hypothetical protein B0T21DRAFT_129560 [Apiosordaria backusii]